MAQVGLNTVISNVDYIFTDLTAFDCVAKGAVHVFDFFKPASYLSKSVDSFRDFYGATRLFADVHYFVSGEAGKDLKNDKLKMTIATVGAVVDTAFTFAWLDALKVIDLSKVSAFLGGVPLFNLVRGGVIVCSVLEIAHTLAKKGEKNWSLILVEIGKSVVEIALQGAILTSGGPVLILILGVTSAGLGLCACYVKYVKEKTGKDLDVVEKVAKLFSDFSALIKMATLATATSEFVQHIFFPAALEAAKVAKEAVEKAAEVVKNAVTVDELDAANKALEEAQVVAKLAAQAVPLLFFVESISFARHVMKAVQVFDSSSWQKTDKKISKIAKAALGTIASAFSMLKWLERAKVWEFASKVGTVTLFGAIKVSTGTLFVVPLILWSIVDLFNETEAKDRILRMGVLSGKLGLVVIGSLSVPTTPLIAGVSLVIAVADIVVSYRKQ